MRHTPLFFPEQLMCLVQRGHKEIQVDRHLQGQRLAVARVLVAVPWGLEHVICGW